MKIIFCSFANKIMSGGFSRLKEQVENFQLFDEIYLCTERDLDRSFRKKYNKYLLPYSKGFGFWIWKSQITLQILEKMNEGDILLYIDAGSHLNINGKRRLIDYFDIVEKSSVGILAFQDIKHLEKEYTKMDLFKYFGVADDKEYTDTKQFEGSHIIYKKCNKSISFLKELIKTYETDFSLITDKPSNHPECDCFIAHRHDQSIFSILAKKYKIETLPNSETYSTDWSEIERYPIHGRRDRVYRYKYQLKYKYWLTKIYRRLWRILYGRSEYY